MYLYKTPNKTNISIYLSIYLRVLCWHGTMMVHAICIIFLGSQTTSGCWDCLWVNASMFLQIQSDLEGKRHGPGRDLKGQLGLYASVSIETIWLPGTFFALDDIWEVSQKHNHLGLCLGSGAGQANDFKPTAGNSVMGWAGHMAQELAYLLVAGGQLSKEGGEGVLNQAS